MQRAFFILVVKNLVNANQYHATQNYTRTHSLDKSNTYVLRKMTMTEMFDKSADS